MSYNCFIKNKRHIFIAFQQWNDLRVSVHIHLPPVTEEEEEEEEELTKATQTSALTFRMPG